MRAARPAMVLAGPLEWNTIAGETDFAFGLTGLGMFMARMADLLEDLKIAPRERVPHGGGCIVTLTIMFMWVMSGFLVAIFIWHAFIRPSLGLEPVLQAEAVPECVCECP